MDEGGLGKRVVVPDLEWTRRQLEEAVERLDGIRLRRRLGYSTAPAVDADIVVPYDDEVRARLGEAVRWSVEDGLREPLSSWTGVSDHHAMTWFRIRDGRAETCT